MTEKADVHLLPPTLADITVGQDVVTADDLSKQEEKKTEDESRSQRLGSDAIQQRTKLQNEIFWIVLIVIVVFYFCFILTAMRLIWSHQPGTPGFPVSAVILVGLLGSIPTLLSLVLLNGLFNSKEAAKDKEEKASIPDVTVTAKVLTELMKLTHK